MAGSVAESGNLVAASWRLDQKTAARIGGIVYDSLPQHNSRPSLPTLRKPPRDQEPSGPLHRRALEKAGHPEAAERLYYILKELADDPDEVPVSQESMAHLAGFIATRHCPTKRSSP